MAAYGEAYATVDASVARSMGLSISGNTPGYEGETPFNVYIHWRYDPNDVGGDGLTGRGWFENISSSAFYQAEHDGYADFQSYLDNYTGDVESLIESYINNWTSADKGKFLSNYTSQLGGIGEGGCLEYYFG